MRKKCGFWVGFAVYLVVSLAGSTAFALKCTDIFEKQVDPLERLANIESELTNDLKEPVLAKKNSFNAEITGQIFKLIDQTEELFIQMSLLPAVILKARIDQLQDYSDKVTEKIFRIQHRMLITSFEKVKADPLLARYDLPYEINGQDSVFRRVILSKEVVKTLFWSEIPQHQAAANRIFQALSIGRVGPKRNGIAELQSEANLFKVRIYGSGAVGAIRAGGYLRGKDFHIVAWSDDRNHDSKDVQSLIRAVQKAKAERGH